MSLNMKDMVLGENGEVRKVTFSHYQHGSLWYSTETGFLFPVPTEDAGDGKFMATDKASLFMRYIRQHIKMLSEQKELLEA